MYLESDEIITAQNGGVYLPNGDETEQTPLFLGRRFAYQGDMDDIFNSGGSGYTLNKAALKYLVVRGFPTTMPHAHTFSEDTMVARVLKKQGIFPYDTKDDAGGERYMPFMVSLRCSCFCAGFAFSSCPPKCVCCIWLCQPFGGTRRWSHQSFSFVFFLSLLSLVCPPPPSLVHSPGIIWDMSCPTIPARTGMLGIRSISRWVLITLPNRVWPSTMPKIT